MQNAFLLNAKTFRVFNSLSIPQKLARVLHCPMAVNEKKLS
jgi:hypothetical protein